MQSAHVQPTTGKPLFSIFAGMTFNGTTTCLKLSLGKNEGWSLFPAAMSFLYNLFIPSRKPLSSRARSPRIRSRGHLDGEL